MTIDPGTRKVELATGFTVGHYADALDRCDQAVIATGVHRRFTERYLNPISGEKRHGFSMMAIACLMIEALESFRQGWPDTSAKGQGQRAFSSFFDAHDEFTPFRVHGQEFYWGVRCGILHQAETTLGWRIRRSGNLLKTDGRIRTVNAAKFVRALARALDLYRDELIATTWNDTLWQRLRVKMERVCANCQSTAP